MPIAPISHSRSMCKLTELLFSVEEEHNDGCKSDGESDVSTHSGHSDCGLASHEAFARCISEETLPDGLPFSRVPSGAAEHKGEEDETMESPRPPPAWIPGSFLARSLAEQRSSLIAVARDGTCRYVRSAREDWPLREEEEEPIIAVARDGTCRFGVPRGQSELATEEEPLLAVRRDGACEAARSIDEAVHVSLLNHLSFNPFEDEERSSVVMVSPHGSCVYFEDGRDARLP